MRPKATARTRKTVIEPDGIIKTQIENLNLYNLEGKKAVYKKGGEHRRMKVVFRPRLKDEVSLPLKDAKPPRPGSYEIFINNEVKLKTFSEFLSWPSRSRGFNPIISSVLAQTVLNRFEETGECLLPDRWCLVEDAGHVRRHPSGEVKYHYHTLMRCKADPQDTDRINLEVNFGFFFPDNPDKLEVPVYGGFMRPTKEQND